MRRNMVTSCTHLRRNVQFPVRSAFMNMRRMLIISMYWSQSLAVQSFCIDSFSESSLSLILWRASDIDTAPPMLGSAMIPSYKSPASMRSGSRVFAPSVASGSSGSSSSMGVGSGRLNAFATVQCCINQEMSTNGPRNCLAI